MLLKRYSLFGDKARIPWKSHIVVECEIKNAYGKPIKVTLRQNRKGDTWWLTSSADGFRMSDTMTTRSAKRAEEWRTAVENGDIQWDR